MREGEKEGEERKGRRDRGVGQRDSNEEKEGIGEKEKVISKCEKKRNERGTSGEDQTQRRNRRRRTTES